MFRAAFSEIGAEILSLKCDTSLNITYETHGSATYITFTDGLKTMSLDTKMANRDHQIGLSISPAKNRLILCPYNHWKITPKICWDWMHASETSDFEVQVPYSRDNFHMKVCAGLSNGKPDALMSFKKAVSTSYMKVGEAKLAWQLYHYPQIRLFSEFNHFTVMGIADDDKKKVCVSLNLPERGFSAFYEYELGKAGRKNTGLVFSSNNAKLGFCVDMKDKSLAIRSALTGDKLAFATLTQFEKEGLSAKIGGIMELAKFSAHAVIGTDRIVTAKVQTQICNDSRIAITGRHDLTSGKSNFGVDVMMDFC